MRWSYDIRKDGKQTSFHGNPLIVDDLILIGTDYSCEPDGVGHVYAFEIKTGKVRWKYQTTSVPTDIVRIGQYVYFGSFQDVWYALKLETGELAWKFATGATNDACLFIRSPVVDEKHLYLAGLDGFIYALDARSGRIAWKQKLPEAVTTALALKDKFLLLGARHNRIYRINAATGTIAGELGVETTPMGRITVTGDSVLLLLDNSPERYGYVVSVTPDLTKLRWQTKFTPEWASERPHVLEESIIVGNCRGELAAVNLFNGASQWKLNLKGCIRSIGSSGKNVFVGVQEGTVYAYELR